MENINGALVKARVVGFFSDALMLGVLSLIAMLSSPEFAGLITEHFGAGLGSSIALMLLSAGVKHLMNVSAIAKAKEKFGSVEDAREPIVFI